jgi:hypothetical protein
LGVWRKVLGRNNLRSVVNIFRKRKVYSGNRAGAIGERRDCATRNAFASCWLLLRIEADAASRCRERLCVDSLPVFIGSLISCGCCASPFDKWLLNFTALPCPPGEGRDDGVFRLPISVPGLWCISRVFKDGIFSSRDKHRGFGLFLEVLDLAAGQEPLRTHSGFGHDGLRTRSGLSAYGWFMHQRAGPCERGKGMKPRNSRIARIGRRRHGCNADGARKRIRVWFAFKPWLGCP